MDHGLAAVKAEFRNTADLARLLKITPQAVSEVYRKGKRVPVGWCLKLEQETDGKFTRHMLRPDIYPIEGEA